MTASSTLPAPNLMPLMRYRNLAEAMTWLEQAFDFEKQIAVTDSDGAVIYGQMSYRGGLIMMGAVRDTDLDKLMRQPDEVGGIGTQSCYLVIQDADAHYARAHEAGAEVVLELKSDGLGRRGYSCRDPEGHIWNFGTYSPGKGLTLVRPEGEPAGAPVRYETPAPPPRGRRYLMGLAALFLAAGSLGWVFADEIQTNVTQRIALAAGHQSAARAEQAYAELVKVRAEKRKAEEALGRMTKDLEAERNRAKIAQGANQTASEKAAQAYTARKAADAELTSAKQARDDADKARRAAEAELASLRTELKGQKSALDDAIEARRVSEEKLAVQAAGAADKGKTPAGSDAAAQPVAKAQPADPASAPNRKEGIETSATRPTAESTAPPAPAASSEAKPDGKDATPEAKDEPSGEQDSAAAKPAEPEDKTAKRRSAAKGNGSPAKRKVSSNSRKLPNYNVDMRGVWPYDGWTN